MDTCRTVPEPVRREWLFPAVIALAMFLLGSLPYAYGYAIAPAGMQFTGFVGRGELHSAGYMMFAKQAREGCHLFENKLTPEPLPRAYFHPEWWLFGHVARWTGLPLIAVFHLHRAAAVAAFVFAVYYLSTRCFETVYPRRLALVLIVFGGGLGWVLWGTAKAYLLCAPELRQWIPGLPDALPLYFRRPRDVDGTTNFGYLINKPHFMTAGATIALAYALLIHGEQTNRRRFYALSGLAGLLHVLIRAFAIRELFLVYALYPAFRAVRDRGGALRSARRCALAGAMLLPAVAYYLVLMAGQVLGRGGYGIPAGTLFDYVLWYGLPFVLLAWCVVGPARFPRKSPSRLVLSLWLLSALAFAQMYPYIKTGEEAGLFPFTIAVALLVVGGPLAAWLPGAEPCAGPDAGARRPRTLSRGAIAALVVACSLSNAVVYVRMFTVLRPLPPSYYIRDDVRAGLDWLAAHTSPDDVVLASPVTSPFIPYYASNKVFTGHDFLTAERPQKDALAARFFGTEDGPGFREDLVREYGVRYVFDGPNERRGTSSPLEALPWLEKVFILGDVVIYRVG